MAFVPNRQDAGDHRPWVLQDLVKVQRIDLADQLHQVHVQIDGIGFTASELEICKGVALRQFERQERICGHGGIEEKVG